MPLSAKDIYQDHLDLGSRLLWEGDFDALAEIMLYPHHMALLDGALTLTSAAELKEAARDFRAFLKRMGAQDYLRLSTHAAFEDTEQRHITGQHETFVLRGGMYVVEPYQSQIQLINVDGDWRNVGVTSAIRNVNVTVLSPAQLRARALARGSASTQEVTSPADSTRDPHIAQRQQGALSRASRK